MPKFRVYPDGTNAKEGVVIVTDKARVAYQQYLKTHNEPKVPVVVETLGMLGYKQTYSSHLEANSKLKTISNKTDVVETASFDKDSGFATFFTLVGVVCLILSVFSVIQCSDSSVRYRGESGQFAIGAMSLIVVAFNCFFGAHIVKILANIRWFTCKTSEKLSSESIDPSLFSRVVDELKKISEQNKEQSESLKKSIEELSEKAEKTNTYLYHIYKK